MGAIGQGGRGFGAAPRSLDHLHGGYHGSPIPNAIHAKSGGYMFWVQSVGAAEGFQIAVHRLVVSLVRRRLPSAATAQGITACWGPRTSS